MVLISQAKQMVAEDDAGVEVQTSALYPEYKRCVVFQKTQLILKVMADNGINILNIM